MFSVQFYVGSAVEWHFRPYNTGGFPGRIAQKARAKVQAKVQSCVCAGVVSAASIY